MVPPHVESRATGGRELVSGPAVTVDGGAQVVAHRRARNRSRRPPGAATYATSSDERRNPSRPARSSHPACDHAQHGSHHPGTHSDNAEAQWHPSRPALGHARSDVTYPCSRPRAQSREADDGVSSNRCTGRRGYKQAPPNHVRGTDARRGRGARRGRRCVARPHRIDQW